MMQRGFVCAAICVGAVSVSNAQEPKAAAAAHLMMNSAELVWGAAPPALPVGASAVVIAGNPAEPGPFTLRLKVPAGYTIAPHYHPTTEHVTVLSGVFSMGTGDAYDAKALHDLSVGGISVMPAETRHFAHSKGGAIVQVHGNGPFILTYVNPADDPRKAPPAR